METEQWLERHTEHKNKYRLVVFLSERESAQGSSHQVCICTAQIRLETLQEQRRGMGRDHPENDNKGVLQKKKKNRKNKRVLTTPVSDLVFRSSFTSPKPDGVERGSDFKRVNDHGNVLTNLTCKFSSWNFTILSTCRVNISLLPPSIRAPSFIYHSQHQRRLFSEDTNDLCRPPHRMQQMLHLAAKIWSKKTKANESVGAFKTPLVSRRLTIALAEDVLGGFAQV